VKNKTSTHKTKKSSDKDTSAGEVPGFLLPCHAHLLLKPPHALDTDDEGEAEEQQQQEEEDDDDDSWRSKRAKVKPSTSKPDSKRLAQPVASVAAVRLAGQKAGAGAATTSNDVIVLSDNSSNSEDINSDSDQSEDTGAEKGTRTGYRKEQLSNEENEDEQGDEGDNEMNVENDDQEEIDGDDDENGEPVGRDERRRNHVTSSANSSSSSSSGSGGSRQSRGSGGGGLTDMFVLGLQNIWPSIGKRGR
jgi:hypothetical protein